jgi:hypothetical protein
VLMQLSASSFQRETISRRLTIFLFYETPKVFRSRHNEVQQIGFLVIHSDPSDTISTSLNAASARPCSNRPPRILVARRARPQRHGAVSPEEDMDVEERSALLRSPRERCGGE